MVRTHSFFSLRFNKAGRRFPRGKWGTAGALDGNWLFGQVCLGVGKVIGKTYHFEGRGLRTFIWPSFFLEISSCAWRRVLCMGVGGWLLGGLPRSSGREDLGLAVALRNACTTSPPARSWHFSFHLLPAYKSWISAMELGSVPPSLISSPSREGFRLLKYLWRSSGLPTPHCSQPTWTETCLGAVIGGDLSFVAWAALMRSLSCLHFILHHSIWASITITQSHRRPLPIGETREMDEGPNLVQTIWNNVEPKERHQMGDLGFQSLSWGLQAPR